MMLAAVGEVAVMGLSGGSKEFEWNVECGVYSLNSESAER